MALSDKIDILADELDQRKKAQKVRALLQNLRSTVLDTNREIQEIVDSGQFGTLEAEFKAAIVSGWNISKSAQTEFEDATIAELLDWRPAPKEEIE